MENNPVYSKCNVEEIKIEGRDVKEVITSIAAISRGKDKSNNVEVRWNALLKEAAMGTAGRPLEYYPVIFEVVFYSHMVNVIPYGILDDRYKIKNMDTLDFINKISRYSYLSRLGNDRYLLCTNYRTMLNAGWKVEEIPPLPEGWYKDGFKIVKIRCPFFIWAQLMTHTRLSKISQSDRVSGSDEYWLPDDVFERIDKRHNEIEKLEDNTKAYNRVIFHVEKNNFDSLVDALVNKVSQSDAQEFFKELGYPREIWSRAPYYFKMKTFIMGGWTHDPAVWKNLFLERGVYPDEWSKTWVQKETKELCKKIEKIVMK